MKAPRDIWDDFSARRLSDSTDRARRRPHWNSEASCLAGRPVHRLLVQPNHQRDPRTPNGPLMPRFTARIRTPTGEQDASEVLRVSGKIRLGPTAQGNFYISRVIQSERRDSTSRPLDLPRREPPKPSMSTSSNCAGRRIERQAAKCHWSSTGIRPGDTASAFPRVAFAARGH